ncbi:acyl-CoA dehydrogenase family protein [Brevibacterium sp. 91QC2O2]|uniref:acyl-CoA dehydrogenase family protein n=1 Tax=Brevibacterium sp. 91QC2O2 TaxID=2968458 RepID=UPI00211BCA38|nr:acyl-CoA dehydrogenase family protein [Brevibacterium sp. 91QC2O2]MCQ9366772.1 acyl-CoA dehydrogenase family protein [Brevibacterium sp. 91QC2O2]
MNADTSKTPAGSERLPVDHDVLAGLADGPRRDFRLRGRAFAGDPALRQPADDPSLEAQRSATTRAALKLGKQGFPAQSLPRALGGQEAFAAYVAGFEETLLASPSAQIKAGVQYGLFGGAIQHLGNAAQHERWLRAVMAGELMGSFAMTEIGHGSDVAALGTTATYDPATQEFEVHTPFRAATKDYIGNAARDARAAVVFARLITRGVDHGIHALFVPLRTEEGQPLPGITIEDDGYKGGLPGVDNGRIAFDRIRVPRANLLDRYGQVAADGTYTSDIESPGRRFFTMLGTLVQGRVSLDGAATVGAKLALDIAVRYALARRQFAGADADEETTLLDYAQHQRRLMPALARTWANAAAHESLLGDFERVFSGADDTDEARQTLETRAAGFKALSTWDALDIVQECREACGGQGFLAENRLVGLHQDLDVYATFEGDNTVLLQLVGKRLLGDYAAELKDVDFGGVARYIGTQAAEHSLYRTGLASAGRTIGDIFTPALNARRIRSGKLIGALLAERVRVMVAQLAGDLRPAAKASPEAAAELFNRHQHELIEAARAYVEMLKWEAIDAQYKQIDRAAHPAEAKLVKRLRDLFGLSLIEQHIGWHLMYGRLPMARARQVGPAIDRLCGLLADNALDVVEAFGFGPEHRRAPIADGAEAARQDEARAHYRAGRATSTWPADEKAIYKSKMAARRRR